MTERAATPGWRWRRLVWPLATAAVVLAAGLLLARELREFHWHDVRRGLAAIPAGGLLACVALTTLNYLILVGYDVLALRAIGHTLPQGRVALASFTGFATSHNLGTLLGGSTVRSRLYSMWGLSAAEIVLLVVLISSGFWLGVCVLGGAVFLAAPFPLPTGVLLPVHSLRVLGAILLAIAALGIAWVGLRRRPLRLAEVELPASARSTMLLEVGLAVVDLSVAASCLFVLLPASAAIGYFQFLGVYLLAIVAVVVTQVPGGVGVMELVVIGCVHGAPESDLLAALLVYRLIYYLAPLAIALALLAWHELRPRREQHSKVASVGAALGAAAPNVVALGVLLVGSVLLLTGATPPIAGRLRVLHELLPLSALEASHFLASLCGAGLVLLARPLHRRIDAAWWAAALLLVAAMLSTLMRGLDYEEAAGAAFLLVILLLCHKRFYRRGSILAPSWTPGWIAAVTVALVCSLWLGWFAHRHVEYSNELWWRFELGADAPRFLRAELGAVALVLGFSLAKLLRGGRPRVRPPTSQDLEEAARIVDRSPNVESTLALLGDKALLFNDSRTAFVMYGVQSRSWVVMGDPVGPEEEWPELLWRFRDLVDRHDGRPVFYQVAAEHLTMYLDHGLALLKLGEEARVDASQFSLEGGRRKNLRSGHHKLAKAGLTFRVAPRDEVPALLPRLREVSDAWLASKHGVEKGFSLGFFDESYLQRFPCAIAEQEGRVIAFANVLLGADHDEFSVDLMRHHPDSPNGLMDFLFCELILWGRQEGYHWFNLGMAPLSGIESRGLSPTWNKIASLLFRHGGHFYRFEGLREYKDKFDPEWRPRYLACPGGLALPSVLADLTRLIGRRR